MISGAKVVSTFGGMAEDAGFMVSISKKKVIGFSLTGTIAPRGGNQILINLEIEPMVELATFKQICIEDVTLSDPYAQVIVLATKDTYKIGENTSSSNSSIDCFKP